MLASIVGSADIKIRLAVKEYMELPENINHAEVLADIATCKSLHTKCEPTSLFAAFVLDCRFEHMTLSAAGARDCSWVPGTGWTDSPLSRTCSCREQRHPLC